jgi:glycosyltransferase involved in cell wall biosynthesis
MRKISAVIITYNEEKNIGRCIDSLQGVADEILVVDSFSTDRTPEIVAERGAVYLANPFGGHIEQKNFAMAQARYDYILSLDADEALDDPLRRSILAIKNDWQADGYTMNRRTNYCGQWIWHCGWYPDRKLRLWDRRKGRWGGVNPHDEVLMENGAKTLHISGDLLHYSFYSISQHLGQVNYFTDIMAKAQFEAGKRSNVLKVVISPVLKFIKSYLLQLGFLDGYYGLVICTISAHASFIKYAKLREYQKSKDVKKQKDDMR